MEYYNNILCVSVNEFVIYYDKYKVGSINGLVPYGTYSTLKSKGKLKIVRSHGQSQTGLISYDSLDFKRQSLVKQRLCNGQDPYSIVRDNEFKTQIQPDPKALQTFSDYRLPDGRMLKPEIIAEYCANASVLNAINSIVTNRTIKRKALNGSTRNIWEVLTYNVSAIKDEIRHSLPNNSRRLKERYLKYRSEGYYSLIHRGFCNDNSRKVTASLEQLILSLYTMPNKPYSSSIHDLYLQFLSGIIDVVDETTGELFERTDFYSENGTPIVVSESTIWNYINDPKNRVTVDKIRTGALDFNNTHRPHHHRHAPNFALSKISMDDRDLPRKMHDGNRVKAYYAYDVASTCIIGVSYSKSKDKSLFIDCMRDMFRFIDKNNLGMPMEVEVEHHLVNNYKNDLMKAGVVFPFVRWCIAGNSQEKRAEHFNRAKKYGYEKKYQNGIGRFYAKLEANKPKYEKVFNEKNDQYKEKTYDENTITADDREIITLYNNDLHPNQKKYPKKTRLDVLIHNLNPGLITIDKALVNRYIGEFQRTTIRRSQYVRVQYADYQIPSPEILSMLEPNNYTVDAYFMYDDKGEVPCVYLYQKGEYIGKCEKINKYNEATAEQTDLDRDFYTQQADYVSEFDAMVKTNKKNILKVQTIENKTDYSNIIPEIVVPTQVIEEPNFNNINDDTDYYTSRAIDDL
jgi:hypothetical protein